MQLPLNLNLQKTGNMKGADKSMEIKRLLCGLGCLCLLSGCSGTGDKSHSNADLSQVITSSQGNNSSAASEDDNQSTPEKAILEFCEAFNQGRSGENKNTYAAGFHPYY